MPNICYCIFIAPRPHYNMRSIIYFYDALQIVILAASAKHYLNIGPNCVIIAFFSNH